MGDDGGRVCAGHGSFYKYDEVITDFITVRECHHGGFGGSHYNFKIGKYLDEEYEKKCQKRLVK